MYSDLNIAENYLEVPYDASAQAYVIDLVPEPDVINYDYLSLGVPHPWAGERPIYNNNLVTGAAGRRFGCKLYMVCFRYGGADSG